MTFPAWVDRIDTLDVERQEGRRPGGQAYLKLAPSTQRVIWHTTEGSSVDGAVATLRANFSAPHFVIGPSRIVQMRPLWAEAATVRGDNSVAWQVEVVGFSRIQPWIPAPETRKPFVELLRFFRDELGVPLERPDGWLDDCSDIEGTWATEGNSRRRSSRAPSFVGHVMHLEWPANTHWDQGAIRWSALLEEAGEAMKDERLDEIVEGVRARRAGLVKGPDWSAMKVFGWNLYDDAVEFPKTTAHPHSGLEGAIEALTQRVQELEDGAATGGLKSGDTVKLTRT